MQKKKKGDVKCVCLISILKSNSGTVILLMSEVVRKYSFRHYKISSICR